MITGKRVYIIEVDGPKINVNSGIQGEQVNVLELLAVIGTIVNAQAIMMIQQQAGLMQVMGQGAKPHVFIALAGEERCRVPGCGKKQYDAIHVTELQEEKVM